MLIIISFALAASPFYIQFVQSAAAPATNSSSCVRYDPSTTTITISCSSASLTTVYNAIHNNNVLSKQSTNGIWLLNAKIIVAKASTFHLDSTDTKWLKISSDGIGNVNSTPNSIDIHGTLKIDSVKITSWNPATNYYAITNGSRQAVPPGTKGATANGYIIHLGMPRPFITVERDATGTTDITNSEIAYLGYEGGSTAEVGAGGINYYGGDGSIIAGDNIHDLYFGVYLRGVGHIIIENNKSYHNFNYGLDPHTGTHDTIIRNNIVHDNGGQGIICSLNCYNILIENNQVYHNEKAGIMFSRNMSNSVARNNLIHNEVDGISVSQSSNNKIYNNTISSSQYGINLVAGSSSNSFYSNIIKDSLNCPIYYSQDSNLVNNKNNNGNNVFYNNQFINSTHLTTCSHNIPGNTASTAKSANDQAGTLREVGPKTSS